MGRGNPWTTRTGDMADKILISAIDCLASVGVTAAERSRPQRLSIDVEFTVDARHPAATDSIEDAINYAEVAGAVSQVCSSREFHLIETVAELIANRVLSDFPTAQIRVLVRKTSPIPAPQVATVSVEIIRP